MSVLECGLNLNIPATRCVAVVIWLRDFVKDDVVLKFGNDFADIADQATVDRELPMWECRSEALDTLEHECEAFSDGFAFGHDQEGNMEVTGAAGQIPPCNNTLVKPSKTRISSKPPAPA